MFVGSAKLLRVAVVIAVGTIGLASAAQAATLRTLHAFCARASCADGSTPYAPLLRDSAGNLYGVASAGGANNLGTVFELVNTGTGYQYEVLHSFCKQSGCPDGEIPLAGLILDTNGHLYGVTQRGGSSNLGTLFELVPGSSGWTIKVRYSFGANGTLPVYALTYQGASSGALYDRKSPLYGVTLGGGVSGAGVAFQVTPVSGQTLWNESVLYAFCSQPSCRDGNAPSAPPIVDGNGNLFGVTRNGGRYDFGVAFQIPAGGGSEIVMHNFCPVAGCPDGSTPVGLTVDGSGNFLGMTQAGGAQNEGAIFRIVPTATGFREAVLYSFCVSGGCPDGQAPQAGLTPDGTGSYFGATRLGGNKQGGVIFRFRPGHYAKIADFCTPTDCPHGINPYAPVILDPSGNVYGTAGLGGANNGGTVVELRRSPAP